jgi:TDG/mug DNA glycosylase family protein
MQSGAIALGHPLGATGAILLGTTLDELERANKTTAVVTMCTSGGRGHCDGFERICIRLMGRTKEAVAIMSRHELDILAPGLGVIFCGLNPATSAVRLGHSFSHPSNRFWAVLHRAGFTDQQLRPEEERRLLAYGCGITAVAQRPTAKAIEVTADEFRRAKSDFEAKVRRYAPRVIAFLGKRAYSLMTQQADVSFGLQREAFAGATTWVLPNPSGLNRRFTIEALSSSYGQLHEELVSLDGGRAVTHQPRRRPAGSSDRASRQARQSPRASSGDDARLPPNQRHRSPARNGSAHLNTTTGQPTRGLLP